ncbi:MAG: DUF1631 family protein [Rubrivivax sp.]
MKPNPVHRLPAPLEEAVQRLKMAAREAAERTIESLGLAALASNNAFQRDGLLGAQFELNRKSAVFILSFNDAFDETVLIELGGKPAPGPGMGGSGAAPGSHGGTFGSLLQGDALSLVEDREVEARISAQRFGTEIAHLCEWELRELQGYVGALLVDVGGDRDRNPLRPEGVGQAMVRGIDSVSERPEIRKLLASELARSIGGMLPKTYAAIIEDLRNAGVQPRGLALRPRSGRVAVDGSSISPGDTTASGEAATVSGYGAPAGAGGGRPYAGLLTGAPSSGSPGPVGHGPSGFAPSTRSGGLGVRRGALLGQVDPALMTLLRRLAHTDGVGGVRGGRANGAGPISGIGIGSRDSAFAEYGDSQTPLPNLIRTHREELRQAAGGSLDHMVIDLIGFLFDQILADPKVPPQMARQIARLQLPVLRAALGDPAFFSSRRHPVRRFVNRIASLGAAFEDVDEAGTKALLAEVRALVQQVVEGDFEQIELYEQKLAALESCIAEAARQDAHADGNVAAMLSEKEDQQRLRQLYAQRLAGDLKSVAAPAFLRDFLSQVWSQVLLRAAEPAPNGSPAVDPALPERLRKVGRELFLSVQPKASPAHRKTFLAELPQLMQALTQGMNLIGWPEADRRDFFNQLMPAHADALKSAAGRALDINLMVRQVEGALQRPLPSRAELRSAVLPVLDDALDMPRFSAEEAARAGLVSEASVDWSRPVQVDIDLSTDFAPSQPLAADAAASGSDLAALANLPELQALAGSAFPSPSENVAPSQGAALAHHVQIGFAYQMNLDGRWQKVRLTHVSAARSFFIFTHGGRHKKTVSLTRRMLDRLCQSGRLRAFETAQLIERATERARRQLAAFRPASVSA